MTLAKGTLAALTVAAAAVSVELYASAKAAMEAEENMARLKKALENSGQATKANLDALVDQSAELQRTTKYSDDAVQSLQALALNLGASAEETKLITVASLDMAAALGTDAEGAAKALTLSLSGNSTALGKLIPEVKTMTDEQLAHGAAIELVAKKYKGFAENEGQTFAGTLAKVTNAFGDLQEEIGAMFTDNEGLKTGMAGLVPILDDIKKLVIDNRDGFKDFITFGVSGLIQAFGFLAKSGVVTIDMFLGLQETMAGVSLSVDKALFSLRSKLDGADEATRQLNESMSNLKQIQNARAAFAETGTAVFKLDDDLRALTDSMEKSNYTQEQTSIVMDEVTVKTDRYAKRTAAMKKETKEAAAATCDYSDAIKEQAEMMDFLNSTSLQQTGAQAQADAANAGGLPNDGALAGMANALGSGSLSSTIGAAMTAMIPGIGGAIASAMGPIMNIIISGNRAEMDKFFQGFADQITSLATNIDDFILSFISSADEIIMAFAMAPTQLVAELAASLPQMLVESTVGMVTGIFDSVKGVFTGLVDTFKGIGDGVKEALGIEEEKGRDLTSDEAKALTDYFYQTGALSDRDYVEARQGIDRTDQQIASDTAYIESLGMTRRAFGGPVTAGESYIVGDGQDGSMRNAEIFTPSKSGTVSKASTGAQSSEPMVVNIYAAYNPHETYQMVINAVKYAVDSKKWRFDPIRGVAVA